VARFDLVAFDVDGTLVRSPCRRTVWEILNERYVGTSEVNRQRYRDYLDGRISYAEWVALDIRGWQEAGASRTEMLEAMAPLRPVAGTMEALAALRQAGMRLVVISGTLDMLLHALLPDAPFDEIHANHIAFDAGGRIAHWRATPFDMQGKAQALRGIAMREGIPLARTAFVGDSSNDVWIARAAGRAIAFNPTCDELAAACDVVVHADDLRALLPHLLDGP
jgi:phosphoserine phosphatase